MSLYGTMQEIMPSASRRHLLGNSNSSRAPLMSFSSKQQRSQPAVLKTIISKRRSMTATNNNNIGVQSKSFVFTMLNPRSTACQAVTFKWFMTLVIVADLSVFIVSTDPDLNDQYVEIYRVWEAVDSWIFLIEYILRLITVTESKKYATLGPIKGRLRYMITTSALIDLAATLPYFLEQYFSGLDLPTLTYLRIFRLLRILKTQGFSEAIKSVCRVFRYNSEILYVAVWIGMGLVMFTAVLMYYCRPRDENNSQFKSLSATIYLSTMMLTGQGGPEGELPWYTSAVVLLTGVFSIGMFAIPASMLTWGFEGEAERLAKLRWRKATGQNENETQHSENNPDNWSYSSNDYSTDEEYLNTIAGFEDNEDDDEEKDKKKVLNLVELDGTVNISLGEYLKLSREIAVSKEGLNVSLRDRSPLANQLQFLENKVDENSKKLDRICKILEGKKL